MNVWHAMGPTEWNLKFEFPLASTLQQRPVYETVYETEWNPQFRTIGD